MGTAARHGHGSVQLITECGSPRLAGWVGCAAVLLGAHRFGLIGLGSLIVSHDLWNGGERSELLSLPYAPLRLIFVGSTALVVLLLLGSAVRRPGARS